MPRPPRRRPVRRLPLARLGAEPEGAGRGRLLEAQARFYVVYGLCNNDDDEDANDNGSGICCYP